MNNSEIKPKDINIDAAIKCYKRVQKANLDYRAKHPGKHRDRARIDYEKMKTERPEKYKEVLKTRLAKYHNDPNKKETARLAYQRVKEKKAQAKLQAANIKQFSEMGSKLSQHLFSVIDLTSMDTINYNTFDL